MMKVVTICGSMKFASQMKDIAANLELQHKYVVFQCVYVDSSTKLSENEILILNNIHKRKIEICDAIYVVNIQGYIGHTTKEEIAYAKQIGKEVLYHEQL
ncbi:MULTISPECIES: hypothetical protein [unclassified Breznakia]|uniref:hypothetical protein n=1 Tax=unclassified Breznakia TaxID=2623764 RepID=UPI0024772594|nr:MULTISPECIES: hypothetical protein [unclassified Breznakia]MDH6366405.1 hypothetical protein [Breznakia sp. PH1-1]MDH6403498.1 hypothetical protein [Breznakia sp. PF1-11]MDH6411207.1 hypothetical protein [Breznakia sp. PFB1-11]MDH6413530.1 hypothetical protein [Breznakia sp. PFB1-14]MDH6415752.1 hypothetical protein [Breznakia sp. PFB1-4]